MFQFGGGLEHCLGWLSPQKAPVATGLNGSQGPSLWGGRGDMPPQLLDRGHNIFCTPQQFVIKSNVFVQISW